MKIFRGTFILVVGSFLVMLLGAVAGLIVARILGPEQYGVFTTGLVLPGALSLSFLLGIDGILTREIARKPEQAGQLFTSAFYPILAWTGFLSLIILWLGRIIGYSPVTYSVLIFGIVIFWFRSLAVLYRTVVRGMERMSYDVLIQLGENLPGIILIPIFFFLFSPSAFNAAIAFAFAALLSVITGAYLCRTLLVDRHRFNLSVARELFMASFPLLLMITLLGLNIRLDTLILSLLSSERQVGLYGAAIGILTLSRSISISYSASLLPRLSVSYLDHLEEFKMIWEKGLRYIVILSILIGISVSLYAPLLLTVLYGKDYSEGVPALRILGITIILLSINTYLWNVLISINKQIQVAIAAFGGLIATIVFSLLLVPSYGSVGSAWATVGRELSQLVLLSWFLRNKVPGVNVKKEILAPIGSGLVLLASLWVIKDTENLLAVAVFPIATAFSIFFLVLTRSIQRDELQVLMASLTSKKHHKAA
jgi:O-antigen/teichoic acid export membrane protein